MTAHTSEINAHVYLHRDGHLTITHLTCGTTQIVPPASTDGDIFRYGSDADYCTACENQGFDNAGLNYDTSVLT